MLQHLQAPVDLIDKRLGKLVELLHTVNCKLNLIPDANDIEYNVSEDPSSTTPHPVMIWRIEFFYYYYCVFFLIYVHAALDWAA